MPPAIPIICGLLPDSLKSQYLVTQKKILMNFCFGFPHFLVSEPEVAQAVLLLIVVPQKIVPALLFYREWTKMGQYFIDNLCKGIEQ